MASGREVGMAEVTNRKTSDTIKWEDLLVRAAKETYGQNVRLEKSWFTDQDKNAFLKVLFSDAKNVNSKEPVEISKNIIDVNEKIYSNHEGSEESEDETTVKIVNCVQNAEGHNYTETTTKGIQWGANANLGLQFGLPQVGAGVTGGVGTSFQKQWSRTQSHQTTKSNRVELQSHHEEVVKIPPGKKVIVRMTSYRVRYKLEYTMEYKIPRTPRIRILYDPCVFCPPSLSTLFYTCFKRRVLTLEQLMNSLPGFRADEEYMYFTQEGELRWIADRMEVTKIVVPV